MLKDTRTNISSNKVEMILPHISIFQIKNDNEFEKLSIDLKFKYCQNHEFCKLKQNLTKTTTFSIFCTNISSFNGNHENLEILLTNLDHKFDVMGHSKSMFTQDSRVLTPRSPLFALVCFQTPPPSRHIHFGQNSPYTLQFLYL